MTQEPDKAFTCHDINRLLKSGTNIASRIFRKLEVNKLIYCSGDTYAPETNKTVTGYKVIDSNKKFVLTITDLPKVEKDDTLLAMKYLASIGKYLIEKPVDLADRKKLLAMLLIATDKIQQGKGKEMTVNLMLDGFIQHSAYDILKYIYTFLKNK